ncbi:hypothetical protein CYMTET_29608 [Cymbomonas tetramitiformis]|uniref:Sulfotransferase n=1 Tax=Cymbomonas tetramitiformis TaxID=36881 RepID=A0AAE0KUR2_9CHLO|nr:hypothetical protein CYMTET_29608 [Cymbomonas tetramitiformis]
MHTILQALSRLNKFHYARVNVRGMFQNIRTEARAIAALRRPAVHVNHQHFIHPRDIQRFARIEAKCVKYINMVREPIERARSNFDFMRRLRERTSDACNCRGRLYDRCIEEAKIQNCTKNLNLPSVAAYFLGHKAYASYSRERDSGSSCTHQRQLEAVEMMKTTIKDHYTFVGTLENFVNSIERETYTERK